MDDDEDRATEPPQARQVTEVGADPATSIPRLSASEPVAEQQTLSEAEQQVGDSLSKKRKREDDADDADDQGSRAEGEEGKDKHGSSWDELDKMIQQGPGNARRRLDSPREADNDAATKVDSESNADDDDWGLNWPGEKPKQEDGEVGREEASATSGWEKNWGADEPTRNDNSGWDKPEWSKDSWSKDWNNDKWDEEKDIKKDKEKEGQENTENQVEEAQAEPEEADWADLWKKDEGDGEEEVDEDYEYADVEQDVDWQCWPPNSKNALSATCLVQKIRARSGNVAFPSDEAVHMFMRFITQKPEEQRILVCALLWLEAISIEVKVVPPNLSEAARNLLEREYLTLSGVCQRVPPEVMNAKAGSVLPTRGIRKQAEETVQMLTRHLHSRVQDVMDQEELDGLVDEVLANVPSSVRILALVHTYEFANLKERQYRDQEALAVAFAKQCMPERSIEMVCRLTLDMAIKLSHSVIDPGAKEIRAAKIDTLNRLFLDWQLQPSEEQLSQLHILPLQRQLQVLLNIEREIERFWYKMTYTVKADDKRSQEMRAYLDFDRLLKPYLREDDKHTKKKRLEEEGGFHMTTSELANLRTCISEVLQKIRHRYKWTPSLTTRRCMMQSGWVARLSALLLLAARPKCLHADEEMRKLLKQESHRKLGPEVMARYAQWYKLEDGAGVIVKAPKILDPAVTEERRRLFSEYQPEQGRLFGQNGYLPMTPSGLGSVSAAPMTPGIFGAPGTPGPGTPGYLRLAPGTPGVAPGTPGVLGGFRTPNAPPPSPAGASGLPMTPGGGMRLTGAPRTPAGPPPMTPACPPPMTPSGPPPMTPGRPLNFAPGTPAGLPPTHASHAPFTPGVAPHTPAGPSIPMTPRDAFIPSSAPFTPAGPFSSAPGTPQLVSSMVPRTPSGAGFGSSVPQTPGHFPSTPRDALGAVPQTPLPPAFAAQSGGMSRIPATPPSALAGTGSTSLNRIPSTPTAAFGDRVTHSVPQTPGASMPMTPAAGVPMTPAVAAPFTPGMSAPLTPSRPSTRGAFVPQPFTPAGPAPVTPAGPCL